MKRWLYVLPVLLIALVFADRAFYWRSQLVELRAASLGDSSGVVVVGDSQVANFPLALLPFPARNLGVSGQGIERICARVPSCETLILQGGINDLLGAVIHERDFRPASIAEAMSRAIPKGQRVYVLSILPVKRRSLLHSFPVPFLSTFDVTRANALILQANHALKVVCWQTGATYLDAHSLLRPEHLTSDGYHVTVSGYRVLFNLIARTVPGDQGGASALTRAAPPLPLRASALR
jgi:hypothetical protein